MIASAEVNNGIGHWEEIILGLGEALASLRSIGILLLALACKIASSIPIATDFLHIWSDTSSTMLFYVARFLEKFLTPSAKFQSFKVIFHRRR
jgi:hypothetical protein